MIDENVIVKKMQARKTALEMCNRYLQNYFNGEWVDDLAKVKNVFQLLNYFNWNIAFTYDGWNLISSTVGWDFAFEVIMKHTWTQSYHDLNFESVENESFIPTSKDLEELYWEEEDEMPHTEIYLILIEYLSNPVA